MILRLACVGGCALTVMVSLAGRAQAPAVGPSYVGTQSVDGRYPLAAAGRATSISVSVADYAGVRRAARDLAADLTKVAGAKSTVSVDSVIRAKQVLVAGTLGRNAFIDGLVRDRKLDVTKIAGKWETFLIQDVEHPADGIDRALVVAGSDERGTIFGLYDISAAIGVSPWTWWSDVPVRRRPELYVLPGAHTDGEPAVRYRGILLGDEASALAHWAAGRFGGVNQKVYERLFELILRLKGNYVRSSIAGHALGDDTASVRLAAEYGVLTRSSSAADRPDELTQLLNDDGFGNLRGVPGANDAASATGVYYHFAYAGPPRSYGWVNSTELGQVWEQLRAAYDRGARRTWIVNVGNLKPMELPISFFLDFAWNPDRIPAASVPAYVRRWAAQQFGSDRATEIGEVIEKTETFAARRKPELVDSSTYSLTNYRDGERVVASYDSLLAVAAKIGARLSPGERDAYYELVLQPIEAAANLNELYVAVARNHRYAADGRAAANLVADSARRLFDHDAAITRYYDTKVAGGKWNHITDQPHIGYASWQTPARNVMPRVDSIAVPAGADMGVAIVEQNHTPPLMSLVLPSFDPYTRPTYHVDVYDRGKAPFPFTASAAQPWVVVTPAKGTVNTERRLAISVDWKKAPNGTNRVPITIKGPKGEQAVVQVAVDYPSAPARDSVTGFIETGGLLAIDAEHFSRELDRGPMTWLRVPDFGRTGASVAPMPATAKTETPGENSPRLDYDVFLFDGGPVQVHAFIAPTFGFASVPGGLRYAVSFDNDAPQIVSVWPDTTAATWSRAVTDDVLEATSTHALASPGQHVLKFWMVDAGVVLERLIVSAGSIPPSYMGPPESYNRWRPTKASPSPDSSHQSQKSVLRGVRGGQFPD